MDYNGFLFDDIASSKIETLQTIQNEALRTITGAFRTTNTNNLHIEANIPILSHRRKYQLLRFYAKASTRPKDITYKTLNNKPRNRIHTRLQRKHPLISQRITKAMEMFNIASFRTFLTPSLRPYWLDPTPTLHFLYKDGKKNVTPAESVSLFHEFKNKYSNFTFIYTDGSQKDGKTGAGLTSFDFNPRTSGGFGRTPTPGGGVDFRPPPTISKTTQVREKRKTAFGRLGKALQKTFG